MAGRVTVSDSSGIGFDGTYVASDGAGSAGHYYRFGGLHLTDFTLRTQPATPDSYAYINGLQVVKVLPIGPPEVLSVSPERHHLQCAGHHRHPGFWHATRPEHSPAFL